ncbi:MAG: SDR family oxidoreductase [Saprospiraceae bacterium]|nr:SDR family oxidoreductase [Saprospiraceae bacterium]
MKYIVITGATGGVGSMLAQGLAANGHHIICLGRSLERLEGLAVQLRSRGWKASVEVADMMDHDQVIEAGERMLKDLGQVDVWINNVGVNNHNAIGPSWELEPQDWWTEVSLNLYTTYIGTRTAINLMKGRNAGYIINLGGGGVQEPKPFGSAYGAAKTAIVKFTETVNIELEQEGLKIKTFAFNPGFIRNTRTEELVESEVARRYMPNLEQILKYGKMSEISDSIELIEVLISGKADALAGRYFFSDDQDVLKAIAKQKLYVEEGRNLLRVR